MPILSIIQIPQDEPEVHAKNGKDKGTLVLGYLPWSLKTRTEGQSEPISIIPIRKLVYKVLIGLGALFFFARRKKTHWVSFLFYIFVCSLLKGWSSSEPWQNRAEQHLTAECAGRDRSREVSPWDSLWDNILQSPLSKSFISLRKSWYFIYCMSFGTSRPLFCISEQQLDVGCYFTT